MNTQEKKFVQYLTELEKRDPGAISTLRRSLAFELGNHPKSYPHVERFIGQEWRDGDARRLAHYGVAGLFAIHPKNDEKTLAQSVGILVNLKGRDSLERRFISLLEADSDGVMYHLQQMIRLLASEGLGVNYSVLLDDLFVLLNDRASDAQKDALKRRWARDFYRTRNLPPEEQALPSTTLSIE